MSGGHNYHLVPTSDGLRMIVRGRMGQESEDVGRALSEGDGNAIVEGLRRLDAAGTDAFRERLLSEVTDAIENCFEGKT